MNLKLFGLRFNRRSEWLSLVKYEGRVGICARFGRQSVRRQLVGLVGALHEPASRTCPPLQTA